MSEAFYSQSFFDEMDEPNLASARAIAPVILALVAPRSVVDIGCGRGVWLKAFMEQGVADVAGYDGSYVDQTSLAFPKEQFHVAELEKPVSIDRPFDLALCLEVAEHLPATAADTLVDTVIKAAPVVLFSAAVPLQGGSRHVNEQWPAYWEEKFRARGYIPVDAVRRRIWGDARISFFYQQNILIYVREDALSHYPALIAEVRSGHDRALPLIHPQLFTYYAERWRLVVPILGKIPPRVLHAAKRLLRSMRR